MFSEEACRAHLTPEHQYCIKVSPQAVQVFFKRATRRDGPATDAIHSGSLTAAPTQTDPVFGFEVITECPNVPKEILVAKDTWKDHSAYRATARKLASLFIKNFLTFENGVSEAVRAAGPRNSTFE
jgi:ATP-dependent phosphoenolpyruvate carboxykinase